MAIKGTYDTIKQAIQDLIAPQLERISGEIAGLKTEVRSLEKRMEEGQSFLHQEIGSLREEVRQGNGGLRGEMNSLREEIRSLREETRQGLAYTNKRLDESAEIRERLAALEAKMAARN
jgi:chromosome segregation ATPase